MKEYFIKLFIENDIDSFSFDEDTKIDLSYYGDVVEHMLVSIYYDEEVGNVVLTTSVNGVVEYDNILEFDTDEIEKIYEIFVSQLTSIN